MRLWGLAVAAAAMIAAPAWAAESNGSDLFNTRCGICHASGGFGANILARRLGPGKSVLAARVDLTPAYVTIAVRRGIGSMPPFSRVEITDPELQAIEGYLARPRATASK